MRFSAKGARTAGVLAFSAFGLLGILLAASPEEGLGSQVFGALLLCFSGWFVWRSARSATVVVTATDVRLQSLFRTRRIPVSEVSDASVGVGRTGPNGFGRQYLLVNQTDGTTVRFNELNAKPPKTSGPQTVVERCVSAINEVACPPSDPSTLS